MPNAESANDLIKLSTRLWDRQRYLATITGAPNLEQSMSQAELVAEVAQQVDDVVVDILMLLNITPPTPQLRRACLRKYYRGLVTL
jgi:hypothetical protein